MEQFFGFIYRNFYTVTTNHGISLILLSLAVSLLLIPLQKIADKLKDADKEEIAQFSSVLEAIKKHYKGTERFYYIQALHRLNTYHPVKSLRGLFGLLIQIPFFFGAYRFLSHYEAFNGTGFLFIDNLAQPDGLLNGINLLPFAMAFINIITAMLFVTVDSRLERRQLLGLSLLFLILLYSSPSALLLYWTMNNLFAFLKEGIRFYRKGKRIALPQWEILKKSLGRVMFLVVSLSIYLALMYFLIDQDIRSTYPGPGTMIGKLIIVLSGISFSYLSLLFLMSRRRSNFWFFHLLLLALFWGVIAVLGIDYLFRIFRLAGGEKLRDLLVTVLTIATAGEAMLNFRRVIFLKWQHFSRKNPPLKAKGSFLLGWGLLSFLAFFSPVVLIIASSPGEFSQRKTILLLAGGVTLLFFSLLTVVSLLSKGRWRYYLLFTMLALLFFAVTNFFLLGGDYGIMDFFVFHSPANLRPSFAQLLVDGMVFLLSLLVPNYLLKNRQQAIMPLLIGSLLFVLAKATPLTHTIISYKTNEHRMKVNAVSASSLEGLNPVYTFSKEGKNVLVIFFDRFIGGFVPNILEDIPSLNQELDGFVWYPNTLSFGKGTPVGLPPINGGYHFTNVEEMDESGYDYNEGFRDLKHPKMIERTEQSFRFTVDHFLEAGWETLVTDPSFLGGRWNGDVTEVASWGDKSRGENLIGRYAPVFMREKGLSNTYDEKSATVPLYLEYLLPFCLFKASPFSLRETIYNKGFWSSRSNIKSALDFKYIANLSLAYTWPFISKATEGENQYIFTTNDMVHDSSGARDNGEFARDMQPEDTMSDNVNIVSDAAIQRFKNYSSALHFFASKEALVRSAEWFRWLKENNVYDNTLIVIVADHGHQGVHNPMFGSEQLSPEGYRYGAYHPLLMVKEFAATGELRTDNTFMTNADVPSIVLNAIDPLAAQKHGFDKSQGFRLYPYDNLKGKIVVSDDIFDPDNWIYTR